MFGISSAEFLLLLFVCFVVLGPKGLKQALNAFRKLVEWGKAASARLREETQFDPSVLGLDELSLGDLDLKQYDPREMVRQAVREEMDAWMRQTGRAGAENPTPGPSIENSHAVQSEKTPPSEIASQGANSD